MVDSIGKADTIRKIEYLQLSTTLINALEDTEQAKHIVEAVECLHGMAEHWN